MRFIELSGKTFNVAHIARVTPRKSGGALIYFSTSDGWRADEVDESYAQVSAFLGAESLKVALEEEQTGGTLTIRSGGTEPFRGVMEVGQ